MSLIKINSNFNKLKRIYCAGNCKYQLSYYTSCAINSKPLLASNKYLTSCKQTAITSKPQFINTCPYNYQSYRSFASRSSKNEDDDDDDDDDDHRPPGKRILPDFGHRVIVIPTVLRVIKNWLNILFIKFFLDPSFRLPEFFKGSKVALQVSQLQWPAYRIEYYFLILFILFIMVDIFVYGSVVM